MIAPEHRPMTSLGYIPALYLPMPTERFKRMFEAGIEQGRISNLELSHDFTGKEIVIAFYLNGKRYTNPQ